jgi:hypothetical protein
MRSALLLACLLLSPLTALSAAVPVVMNHPGYLVLDGNYYIFAPPSVVGIDEPARLTPRGAAQGFDFRAIIELDADPAVASCTPGDGNAGAPPPGVGYLRRVELRGNDNAILVSERLFELRGTVATPAHVSFASCDGALVMFAMTATGTTSCSGAVAFPFRRGECAAIDDNDPGHVFFNAFEG